MLLNGARTVYGRALPRRATYFRFGTVGVGRGNASTVLQCAFTGKRALQRLFAIAVLLRDADPVLVVAIAARDARPLVGAVGARAERHLAIGIRHRGASAIGTEMTQSLQAARNFAEGTAFVGEHALSILKAAFAELDAVRQDLAIGVGSRRADAGITGIAAIGAGKAIGAAPGAARRLDATRRDEGVGLLGSRRVVRDLGERDGTVRAFRQVHTVGSRDERRTQGTIAVLGATR